MKQFDFETSNYKHKEEVKTFVLGFNDMVDKFVKTYDNRDQEIKKIESSITKKEESIEKLDISIADLSKKTDEFKALKELANNEIAELNLKKSEISYTDSEVQKMELDDINSQIAQKRNKISKVDAKLDTIKAKVKTSNDEKKTCEKELKDLEKNKKAEEEALYRTDALLGLIDEVKNTLNDRIVEIMTEPYHPKVEEVHKEPKVTEEEEVQDEPRVVLEEVKEDYSEPTKSLEEVIDEETTVLEEVNEEQPLEEEAQEEPKEQTNEPKNEENGILGERFQKEGIDFNEFSEDAKTKMQENTDTVIKNLDILKRHSVPLEYTKDQPEIFYDISSQDLDDLLSIITTDDEGNGMGFSIDFTFNILNELSKINVDRLIDVYNSEFMNVNAKSGIIHLLKLTNPGLTEFSKNKNANIELLNTLGTNKVDEIVEKYPDFINMDNPLFVSVLNMFDKNDLVEKINSGVEVIPKILDYWKNN